MKLSKNNLSLLIDTLASKLAQIVEDKLSFITRNLDAKHADIQRMQIDIRDKIDKINRPETIVKYKGFEKQDLLYKAEKLAPNDPAIIKFIEDCFK